MAITRQLDGIGVQLLSDGSVRVLVHVVVQDDVEGTSAGISRIINNANIGTIATNLRDAVVALAASMGKPVTITQGTQP